MNLVSFVSFVWRLNFNKWGDSCLFLFCEKYYTLSDAGFWSWTDSRTFYMEFKMQKRKDD